MGKDREQAARRARSDHAAAAIEALHAVIEHLRRAQYHIAAIDVAAGTAVMARVIEAAGKANCAHALAKIMADRLP